MSIKIIAEPLVIINGRTANHFGIGEVVNLRINNELAPPRNQRRPVWRWDIITGSDLGNFSYLDDHARLVLLNLAGGSMTIRVKDVMNQDEAIIILTIEAPEKWSLGPIQYRYHAPNLAHAAFRAAIQIENSYNVSFDNIEMREGNALPQCLGRYKLEGINSNNHHNATYNLKTNWIDLGISRQNLALQAAADRNHLAIAIDRVSSSSFGPRSGRPTWPDGSFTWDIPWTYRLSNKNFKTINGNSIVIPDMGFRHIGVVITHKEILVGNKMTIRKGGQSYTCYANDPQVGDYNTWNL